MLQIIEEERFPFQLFVVKVSTSFHNHFFAGIFHQCHRYAPLLAFATHIHVDNVAFLYLQSITQQSFLDRFWEYHSPIQVNVGVAIQ